MVNKILLNYGVEVKGKKSNAESFPFNGSN